MLQAAEHSTGHKVQEDRTINDALNILEGRLRSPGAALNDGRSVRQFLRLHLSGLENERFCGLFLDSQHRLIKFETITEGTIDSAVVYPREVVKRALTHNAAAVIFAHNHPSGFAEPSTADRVLTDRLRDALRVIDIRVLDHFVVGDSIPVSFSDRGYLGDASPKGQTGETKSGLKFTRWGNGQQETAREFEGTEAELVAGGLIRPEWVPGVGDNGKTQQRVVVHGDDARLLKGRGRKYRSQKGERVLRITRRSQKVLQVWEEGDLDSAPDKLKSKMETKQVNERPAEKRFLSFAERGWL